MSGFDLSALKHAELVALRARLDAAMAATAPHQIKVGERVCFDWGGSTFYGSVLELLTNTVNEQQRAALRIAGHPWVHLEPLQNLRRVCGECTGCRSLAHVPECLQ